MGKKGTKRKTRWRTLSIGEAGDSEGEVAKTNGGPYAGNGGGGVRYHSGYHQHNPRYNGKGVVAGTGRTFSSQSTPTRRTGSYHHQHQNYMQNGGGRSHSSTGADAPKITFNEDEYTRITTPRQDVLFKKGYLSRRKPLVATPSTSSAEPGASTSAPSTPSTQSTSPEHHANTGELPTDPELMIPEGLMIPNGFYDQNGVFYVNTMANFDGFGPMMMLPYGPYPPYGHIEYYNPVCMHHPYNHSASCVGSQISDTLETPETGSPQNELAQSGQEEDSGKASAKETADSESGPQSADGSESSTAAPATAALDGEEECEEGGGGKDDASSEQPAVQPHDHAAPPHMPPMAAMPPPHYIYPGYMFGPQMYHINGMNIQCGNAMTLGGPMDLCNKQKLKKKRRRKQRKPSGCNGTTATDYSEDEYSSDSERASTSSQRASSGSSLMSNTNGFQEQWLQNPAQLVSGDRPQPLCDPLKSVLNTNCSEFIPKAQLIAKSSQLKTDVCEFVPQNMKDLQKKSSDTQIVNNVETETTAVQEKIEIAVQTKDKPAQETAPVAKKVDVPLTNGYPHKEAPPAKKPAVVEHPVEVRKVQIICVEKPSPVVCSTPRSDQWTTVKKSRSKNKKGRQETSSASPTSPVSDVASENTFQMFVDGNITPPPSEEDGSLETEKLEETIYFTSDDAIDNAEETTVEETNHASPKKNAKPTKTKSKKCKNAVKEQVKGKGSQYSDCNGDERKNTKSDRTNGKAHKPVKQVNMATVKSNLSKLTGPKTSNVIEYSNIECREVSKMSSIGLDELKRLYIELPELKDPQLENMLEAAYRNEAYDYETPVLTVTPSEVTHKDVLPPTPDESIEKSEMVLSNNNTVSEEKVDTEETPVDTSDAVREEDVSIESQVQIELQSEEATDKTSAATVVLPTREETESPDISTFNSVPDITEDTTAGEAKEALMDEGVILGETTTPTKESEEAPLYLTEAVRRWLSEQKDKSPEPVLREPDDPALAELMGVRPGTTDASGSSDQDSDDMDDGTDTNPKNLKGNPLRASSVKRNDRAKAKRSRSTPPAVSRGRGQEHGDTDSDYLSDIQDDGRKRVAGITSEPDLLDCWEPDILPFSALPHLCANERHEQLAAAEQAEDVLEAYESVYGKSVDYDKLSASLGAAKPAPAPLRGEGVAPPCSGICCTVM